MKRIGFIGLGSMGLSMALNLRKAGFEVMGFNRTREKEAPLLQAGGLPAKSLKAVGEQCEVLVLCLPTDGVVREMMLGEGAPLPETPGSAGWWIAAPSTSPPPGSWGPTYWSGGVVF